MSEQLSSDSKKSERRGNRKLIVYLIVFGCLFVGGTLGTVFIQDLQENPYQNAKSYSLLGHHAFRILLKKMGYTVTLGQKNLRSSKKLPPILYLAPQKYQAQKFLKEPLETYVHRHLVQNTPILLALPKWEVSPSQKNPNWIDYHYFLSTSKSLELANQILKKLLYKPNSLSIKRLKSKKINGESYFNAQNLQIEVSNLQVFSKYPSNAKVLVNTAKGALVLLIVPKKKSISNPFPSFLLISDPDIFTNSGLSKGENGFLAFSLIEYIAKDYKKVIIDEISHGLGKDQTLLQFIFDFPGVFVTLHLILSGIFLGLFFAKPFQNQLEEPRKERSGAEQVRSMAYLTFTGGDHFFFLKQFLLNTLHHLQEYYPILEQMSLSEKIDFLEKIEEEKKISYSIRRLFKHSKSIRNHSEIEFLLRQVHFWKEKLIYGKHSRTQSKSDQ